MSTFPFLLALAIVTDRDEVERGAVVLAGAGLVGYSVAGVSGRLRALTAANASPDPGSQVPPRRLPGREAGRPPRRIPPHPSRSVAS